MKLGSSSSPRLIPLVIISIVILVLQSLGCVDMVSAAVRVRGRHRTSTPQSFHDDDRRRRLKSTDSSDKAHAKSGNDQTCKELGNTCDEYPGDPDCCRGLTCVLTPPLHYSGTCQETWATITQDDFENGWGSFTGNDEAELVDGAACLEEKGIKSPMKSSFYHTANHDVTAYAKLRVELSFHFTDQERFFLEYSSNGGNSWTVMKRFIRGRPFHNNVTYTRSVDFDASGKSYELTNNAKIRFRSKANVTGEVVCIDNVKFEGQNEL